MREPRVTFHRVEDYTDDDNHIRYEKSIICSFETEQLGYLQVAFNEGGVDQLKNEPDLNILRERDRKYVERVLTIVWRMIFDAPAAKERFQ